MPEIAMRGTTERRAVKPRKSGARRTRGSVNGAVKSIFLSHISEEAEVAALIRDMLERDFPGKVDLFASTAIDGIAAGQPWLDSIEQAMEKANVALVLCSKSSVHRQWVHFELGAAWMRRIPIVPICHSGLTASQLEIPLSLLQAIELDSATGLRRLYAAIAAQLGVPMPALDDLEDKLKRVRDVETRFRRAGTKQFESFIDVVIPPPGKLHAAEVPAHAKIVSDAHSLQIFGLQDGSHWTWGDIERAAQKVTDTRWLTQLQESIHLASRDETFEPVQAVYHARPRSYQPQLARRELSADGEARFHIHFVDTVVAPLNEVDNEFGLLATMLRLGLRFRYEVIERFLRGVDVPDDTPGALNALRAAIEVIENDAHSRGAQNITPASIVALFDQTADRDEITQVRRDWDDARALLFRAAPEPSADGLRALVDTMRRVNVRFMTLGTRRFHEMVKAHWR